MAHSFRSRDRAGYQPLQLELSSPELGHIPSAISPPPQSSPFTDPATGQRQSFLVGSQDNSTAPNQDQTTFGHGLGLRGPDHKQRPQIKRVPVASKKGVSSSSTFSPIRNVTDSPLSARSQPSTAHSTPFKSQNDADITWPSSISSSLSLKQPEIAYRSNPSQLSLLQPGQAVGYGCPTNGDILKSRWTWYCYAIVILALFSTIFSGIFLGIALRKPRWNGLKKLPVETATLLSALFSKLIELSFACVFVATLGQILSRRAFAKTTSGQQGGVSIAEINMKLWILQPGTLLTHWTGAWSALKTALGLVVLLAAVAAALYITAAEALVSPKLSFGKNETRELVGKFATMYANPQHLSDQCETPISRTPGIEDKEGSACMSIKYAGQSYRNFGAWMTNWGERIHSPFDLDSPEWRPPPVAMMFDNTTVQGQWIFPSNENITIDSERYGRLVHNVTMAMPHANVVHAVRDPRNGILQPEDLRNDGEYYVEAAIPAPILNVLCVGMSADEIGPMIRDTAPETGAPRDPTTVDDIFGFKQEPDSLLGDDIPWFPVRPQPFNMVLHRVSKYGQKAIYVLSASPGNERTPEYTLCALKSALYPHCTTSYHVAQSGSDLAVHCSYASYNDTENSIPYSKFNQAAPVGVWNGDWPSVGDTWATSVALSHGLSTGNASISRILSQMTPSYGTGATMLDPKFPTLSEGLSVLAGSTLLLSSDHSPFVHMWNYTGRNHFDIPQDQRFASLLSYKDYSSGNSAPWQGIFYVVLLAVFLLNLFCLCYLLWMFYTDGEVTDYTEPQNLFALAINSPPSNMMSGSCGPGPNGDMLQKKWMVDIAMSSPKHEGNSMERFHEAHGSSETLMMMSNRHADAHPHFYVRCSEDDVANTPGTCPTYAEEGCGPYQQTAFTRGNGPHTPLYRLGSPFRTTSSNWWSRTGLTHRSSKISGRGLSSPSAGQRPKSVNDTRHGDWRVEESPAVEQYKRLTSRR